MCNINAVQIRVRYGNDIQNCWSSMVIVELDGSISFTCNDAKFGDSCPAGGNIRKECCSSVNICIYLYIDSPSKV